MSDTKNALAELAEFLKEESKVSESEEFKARAIASFGEDSWKRYLAKKRKMLTASRIVAELAKVGYGDYGHIRFWVDTEIKLKRCRAIAEEGSGDAAVG